MVEQGYKLTLTKIRPYGQWRSRDTRLFVCGVEQTHTCICARNRAMTLGLITFLAIAGVCLVRPPQTK